MVVSIDAFLSHSDNITCYAYLYAYLQVIEKYASLYRVLMGSIGSQADFLGFSGLDSHASSLGEMPVSLETDSSSASQTNELRFRAGDLFECAAQMARHCI